MKTTEIYPIATLPDLVLVINARDLSKLDGGVDQATVKAIKVDIRNKRFNEPILLDQHLKFNPWEEITDPDQRDVYQARLRTLFSEAQILDMKRSLS